MDLVISNPSNVPVLGAFFMAILFGGSEIDVVPLYRGYAFHVWFLHFDKAKEIVFNMAGCNI